MAKIAASAASSSKADYLKDWISKDLLLLRSIQDWESPWENLTGQSVRDEGLLLLFIQDWMPQEKVPKPDWPKCPQWGVTFIVYSGLNAQRESPQTWLARLSAMRGYFYCLFRTKCPKRKPPNLTGQSVHIDGLLLRSIQDWESPPNLTGQNVRNEGLLLQFIQDWMTQEKAPKPDWPKCPHWGVAVTVYSGLRKPPNLTGQNVRNEGLLLRFIQDWMPQEKAPKPDWPKCLQWGVVFTIYSGLNATRQSPQTWLAKVSAMRGCRAQTCLAKVSAMRGCCYGLFRTEIAPKHEWPKCPQWGVTVTVYSGLKMPPNLTGQDVRNEGLLLRSIQDWEIPQTWLAKVSAMRGYCYGLFRTEKAPKPDWPKCPQWAVAVTVYSGLRKPPNLTGLSVRNKGLLLQSFQDWESPQTWLAWVSAMSDCCYSLFRTEKAPKPDWPECPQWGVVFTIYSGLNATRQSPQTWLAKVSAMRGCRAQTCLAKVSAMRGCCYGLFRTEIAPKPEWPKCPQWGVTVTVYSGLKKPPNLTGQDVRNEGLLLRSIQDWEIPQTWLAKVSAMRGYCYGLFRTEKAPKPDWPKCPQWAVAVTVYSGLRKPPNLTGLSVRNKGLLLRSIQDWESPQTWLAWVSAIRGCCYSLFRTEKAPKPDWLECPQWAIAVTVFSGLRKPPNLTGQNVRNEGLLLQSIQDWTPQDKAPKPDWPECPQWGVVVTVYSGLRNPPNLTGQSVRNERLLLQSIQDWESPQTWLAKVSAMSGCCYGLFRTEKSPKPDWPKCPQ